MNVSGKMWHAIVLSVLSITSLGVSGQELKLAERGVINIGKPAFLFLDRKVSDGSYRLLVTSFRMFGSDEVTAIENIGANLTRVSDAAQTSWTKEATWPNEIKRVPSNVFGDDFFLICGGFLVPGKSQGALSLYDLGQGKIVRQLSSPKKDYWYHHAIWVDMNGDGRLDILTARAKKPMFGGGSGEILWLEQPASPLDGEWTEHVIAQGPDVNFIYEDLDGSGVPVILATEFFGGKLTLLKRDGDAFTPYVIDDKLGAGFDLSLVDLNGDGRKEILATNHTAKGAVYAYEIPQELTQTPWVRHTLLDGIATTASGFGQASPGKAIAFYPNSRQASGKPHIVVAGDGAQMAFLLNPVSSDPNDWTYRQQIILTVKSGVIGQIAVGDVDGDGMSEIFIPAYDENAIHVFSVK